MKKSVLFVCCLFFFQNSYCQFKDSLKIQTKDSIQVLILDPLIQIEATDAVNDLYNFKFEKAEAKFQEFKKRFPEHPLPYFLLGLSEFWKIIPNEENPQYDIKFISLMDSSIEKAKVMYKKNHKNPEATFFLAGAHGFEARIFSDRKMWGKAIWAAKNAVKYLHENENDINLGSEFLFGRGLYNYYAEWIPENYPLLKPVLALFPVGKKKTGIQQLNEVANNAFYTRTEAQTYLLRIYVNEENNYRDAYKISTYLVKTFPDNPYFARYHARICYSMGFLREAEKLCLDILNKIDKQYTGYEGVSGRYASFYLGYIYKSRLENKVAATYFEKAIKFSEDMQAYDMGYYLYSLYYLAQIRLDESDVPSAELCYDKLLKHADKDHETYTEAKNYKKNKKK